MASKKETDTTEEKEIKFSKHQIVMSRKYETHRDFLEGNLEDRDYSFAEVDEFLKKYY